MSWSRFWKTEPKNATMPPPGWSADGVARMQRVSLGELWLWVLALGSTLLAGVAFLLLSIPGLFGSDLGTLRLDPDSVTPGLMALVLLLNICVAYRQWQFRQTRGELVRQATGAEGSQGADGLPTAEVDPLTGLITRPAAEAWLTKQIATARRQGKPVTVLAVGLEDLDQVHAHCGQSYVDQTLKDVAHRLRSASRGSDLAARAASTEFLLLLPDCPTGEAKKVADRLPPVEVHSNGKSCTVGCTTAWVDYEPGQSAGELVGRALDMLKLYKLQ